MFGDNQAGVSNITIPHTSLNKRSSALSYHRVRDIIAAKILEVCNIILNFGGKVQHYHGDTYSDLSWFSYI
jgi:hypothetical protein